MMPSRCQLIKRIELPPPQSVFSQLAFPSSFGSLAILARDAPLMRSIRHWRTEPIRPRRTLEKAEFDQYPDRADDRDNVDKHPPAGFVAVVKAFDIDDNGRDQRDQREDAA
jgi:hypothetical protein